MKIFILLTLLILNACQNSSELKIIKFKIHDHVLSCELAQTQEQREKGLMYRTKLDKNQAMLFIFPKTYAWPFWMKNTLIPLDIIWLDQDQKIVYLLKNLKPCPKGSSYCPSYFPPNTIKSKYVLELNAGQIDAIGLKLDEHLNFSIEQ